MEKDQKWMFLAEINTPQKFVPLMHTNAKSKMPVEVSKTFTAQEYHFYSFKNVHSTVTIPQQNSTNLQVWNMER